MIWVLVCALVSLGVAEELDILYPDLEHSRTIYVTGKTARVSLFNLLHVSTLTSVGVPVTCGDRGIPVTAWRNYAISDVTVTIET